MNIPLLSVNNLRVDFQTSEGEIHALRDVNVEINPGERLAVVGESGSGKTQLFNAVLGLLAKNGRASGQVLFDNVDLLRCNEGELNRIRGDRIGMIFQDPMTSLNPYLTIERQLTEVLQQHRNLPRRESRIAAINMLGKVRIPDAARRLDDYPHQLSGGMRQRVVIAMAMLCNPQLLIADEPTTALDVTVQAEIMCLLRDLAAGQALVLITHDLSLVAGLCNRVVVMYAGRIVESGSVEDIFYHAIHPYTKGLLKATPRQQQHAGEALYAIPGQPPDPARLPTGCAFRPRCSHATDVCAAQEPMLKMIRQNHSAACILDC